MRFDGIGPFVVVNLLCFFVATAIVARSSFYRGLLDGLQPNRAEMLDGLRGWLALGVFLTHAANMYFYFGEGVWASERAGFYLITGQVGVSLFSWSRPTSSGAGSCARRAGST